MHIFTGRYRQQLSSFTKMLFALLFLLPSALNAAEIRWFELISSDAKSANAFYADLFGWDIQTGLTGSFVAYLDGKPIAGISQIDNTGVENESQWFPALLVKDLNAVVDRARKGNAEVLEPITSVAGFGEYAVIRDPQGGIMMLSNSIIIPDADRSEGNWIWGELWTVNPVGSADFYESIADMKAVYYEESEQEEPYYVFSHLNENVAGLVRIDDNEFGTGWAGYIAVDNIDETVQKAKALGGKVFDATVDQHGTGKVAVLADPTGAVFFIYELPEIASQEVAQ